VLRSKLIYLVLSIIFVATLVLGLNAAAVSADDTTTTTTTTPTVPVLRLTCDVPSYSDISGATYSYTVVMHYNGNDTLNVNFSTVNPTGWNSSLQFNSKEISSLPIGPIPQYASEDTKSLSITLTPNSGNSPDPGSYVMTLNAVAGQFNLKNPAIEPNKLVGFHHRKDNGIGPGF